MSIKPKHTVTNVNISNGPFSINSQYQFCFTTKYIFFKKRKFLLEKKKKRMEELKLEEQYKKKIIQMYLKNYNRLQISLLAFNALVLLNVITITRHMPHDCDITKDSNHRYTPAPVAHIESYFIFGLLVEAGVAFVVLLQVGYCYYILYQRQQRQHIDTWIYHCMVVVYVLFWIHVLGINFITSKTHRFFARFIADIFYILSFSVFPFRFCQMTISSIILAIIVDGFFSKYNNSFFFE
ncbi:hypothetical protein RFI_22987 [Reticulomyxa filosa]|uniref:Uncharacterized protein n=1 Tax=Reticulomyxa filosa TaxID=46433 RepID=X6MLA1_RETFI|nr:hypothetical protein RFI_22987 [Reticulomyxa filosa]|eukprot:ETO14381.1 hypothetical protein RFI_22987 [Reticulomyxa filosa]